jgi:hypothetical protein
MSEPKTPKPKPRKSRSKDIAILNGPTEDGLGARVLRIRQGTVSAGEIRPVKDGEPITHNEVVRLHPIDADQRVCEVEVLHDPALPDTRTARDGKPETRDHDGSNAHRDAEVAAKAATSPRRARVSTPTYRKNWSAIFEQKGKRGSKTDWSVN